MPWVLIPGALQRLRTERKLDRPAAAKLLGLSVTTIRRHETDDDAPLTLQAETVRIYRKGYECDPEAFARWVDHEDAQAIRRPTESDAPGAPQIATLTARVRQELAIGAPRTITHAGKDYEIVGHSVLQDCMAAYALQADKQFVVHGKVRDVRYLPDAASDALEAERGKGASFRIDRQVVKGVPLYVSVFTRDADTTRTLLEAHKTEQPVSVLVDIRIKPAAGDWKGFFIFEKTKVPRPWVFCAREVIR